MAHGNLSLPELEFLTEYASLDPKQKDAVGSAYRKALGLGEDVTDTAVMRRVGALVKLLEARIFLHDLRQQMREQMRRSASERVVYLAGLRSELQEKRLEKANQWLDDADGEKPVGQAQLLKAVAEVLKDTQAEGIRTEDEAVAGEDRIAELENRISAAKANPITSDPQEGVA